MSTSVPIVPKVTQAGLAAIFNLQGTGVEFLLSHVAFGTGQYDPSGLEVALQAEKIRVPIAGGGMQSPTQAQIYASAIATLGSPFFAGEIGFFGDDGATLLAVYSSTASPVLFISDSIVTAVSYGLGLEALPAGSVNVTVDPSAAAALLLIGDHVTAPDPHPQYVQKINGIAVYDPLISYNLHAEVIGDDGLIYQSAIATNLGNTPSASPSDWLPLFNYGDTPITLAGVTFTLTSTEAAKGHITATGVLTANVPVIFPTWVKDWTFVNNTTGPFSVTCKTAAGAGVVVSQGMPSRIHGDGVNITQFAEQIAPATQPDHAVRYGQTAPLYSISSLPTANIGPITVIECGEVWLWSTSIYYTGYRSPLCGRFIFSHLATPFINEIDLVGGSVSKTAYPALWGYANENSLLVTSGNWVAGAYNFVDNGNGTFMLPDMRNQFLRSTGTNADTANARTMGSYQVQAFKSHAHDSNVSTFAGGTLNRAVATQADQNEDYQTGLAGGSETRPVNTAFLPRIHV